MKRKFIVTLLTLVLGFLSVVPSTTSDTVVAEAATRTLTKSQQHYADKIAEVAIDKWDKYGVLPSVAVTQAFIESTLGDHCRGYNLWGICSGAVTYDSLDEGIISYLKVINNGYYKGAPFEKNYKVQLRKILDGGYCYPEGKYYSNALWSVDAYDFDKYDKKLFRKLEKEKKAEQKAKRIAKEKKEREENQKGQFKVVYDPTVPSHAVYISNSIVKSGAVLLWYNDMMYGIYDVISTDSIKDSTEKVVYTSDPTLVGKYITIEANEEAKG